MKVLGIDPALSNFGLAFAELDVDDLVFGIIKLQLVETAPDNKNKQVRKNSIDLKRCRTLYGALREATSGVAMVFVEMPVGSQSARAMASYGFCIGLLASVQVPMIQLTPSEVKLAAVGDKNATKQEMIDWATDNHPHTDWLRKGGKCIAKNEHLADAVACIEAGIRTDQFKQAMAAANWLKKAVEGMR